MLLATPVGGWHQYAGKVKFNLTGETQALGTDRPLRPKQELILIYTCRLRGLLRTCILALQSVKVSIPAQSRDCFGNWHDREYAKNIAPSSFLTSVPSRLGQALKADRQIYQKFGSKTPSFAPRLYKT